MNILGRGKPDKPDQKAAKQPIETKPSAPAAAPSAPAPAPAPAAAGPDPALEAALKRMGEQVARVQTSVETSRTESKELAGKLAGIEESLRSMMTLSEALSNAFNPLSATWQEAPAEKPASLPATRLPSPRPASAAPREIAAAEPAPAPVRTIVPVPAPPEPEPPGAAATASEAPHVEAASVVRTPAPAPSPAAPAPAPAAPTVDRMPSMAELFEVPAAAVVPAGAHGNGHGHAAFVAALPGAPDAALRAMQWLDQLAASAGSEGARRALAYYEAIGWIGPAAHARLLVVMGGLAARAPPQGEVPWLEVHAASFAELERLRASPEAAKALAAPVAGDHHGH
ncbi:MAG TPA: FlaD/FlaE family flagellar protein [Candidatus Thermoplasmatota archaeon]|jgi:hypothetical protein|nr:FlaD/FlaE family flagellar protein [Candidatus Thermoplasmatota archaeon]